MSDIITKANPSTETDYEELMLKMLNEMNHLEELMGVERAASDRLKIENAAIRASTETKLARLERHMSSLSGAE